MCGQESDKTMQDRSQSSKPSNPLNEDISNQLIKGENDDEIEFWDKCVFAAMSNGREPQVAAIFADRALISRRQRHYS